MLRQGMISTEANKHPGRLISEPNTILYHVIVLCRLNVNLVSYVTQIYVTLLLIEISEYLLARHSNSCLVVLMGPGRVFRLAKLSFNCCYCITVSN
jgi:hypothetical protein